MTTLAERSPLPLSAGGQPQGGPQPVFTIVLALVIAGLALIVWQTVTFRAAYLVLLGCVLGFALFRAAFGFTGAWRNFIVHRRGHGVRVTLLMLGVASIGIIPLIAVDGYSGVFAPIGWSLVIGAFMFGVGMQLGGGCGSGTLYVAGGGSGRLMITLLFFIVGSVIGSVHAPWWASELPRWQIVRFSNTVGIGGALAVTLIGLAILAWVTVLLERRRHGRLVLPEASHEPALWRRVILGPWGAVIGGVVMGLLAILVVVVTGRTWGITFGYTLWGAQALHAMGFDLTQWTFLGHEAAYWAVGWRESALEQSLFRNTTSAMNVGLFLGAALAAGLIGKWRPTLAIPFLSILAAALGGLLMGYGARISFGCNIGALVGGITSGSLHGWVWMAAAFAGTMITVPLRPWFRMAN